MPLPTDRHANSDGCSPVAPRSQHRQSRCEAAILLAATVTALALTGGCTRSPRATLRYDLARSYAIATVVTERTALDFGTPDSRPYLRRGWYGNERNRDGSFVWSRGLHSTIELPLTKTVDRQLRLRVRPYRPPGAPPLALSVEVNGAGAGAVVLDGGPTELWLDVPAELWKIGDNLLGFRYSYSRRTLPRDDRSTSRGVRDVGVAWDSLLLANRKSTPMQAHRATVESSRDRLRLSGGNRLDFPLDLEPGSALHVWRLEVPPGSELIVQLRVDGAASARELARLSRSSSRVEIDFGLEAFAAARLSLIASGEEADDWIELRRPQIVVPSLRK